MSDATGVVVLEWCSGQGWHPAGTVTAAGRPGSVRCADPAGVFVFGWVGGQAGVWAADLGVEFRTAYASHLDARVVSIAPGSGPVCDLSQPFEAVYKEGTRIRIRFLEEEPS
jgi:hypothetical protein